MKKHLVSISLVLFVAFAVGAYYSPPPFWQTILINISTTFLALAVAVIAVNIYLEKDRKKGAVQSVLIISNDAIASFHNRFVSLLLTKFGEDEFNDIWQKYINSGGKITVITPDARKKLYILSKEKNEEFELLIGALDKALEEMIGIVGWELEPALLEYSLKCRNAIRKYNALEHDESDESIMEVAENIIDIDTMSQIARDILLKLGGIEED